MISGGLFLYGQMATLIRLKFRLSLMIMEKLSNVHPGEILNEEFLKPLNITAYRLSKDIKIPQTRISEILKGRRRITADTALRLSKYFGTSPKFWLGLQDDYDLEEEELVLTNELATIMLAKVA